VYNIDVEQNSASKRTYNQQNYVKHNNSTTTLQPHTAQQYMSIVQLFSKQVMYRNYVLHRRTKYTILHGCRHKVSAQILTRSRAVTRIADRTASQ